MKKIYHIALLLLLGLLCSCTTQTPEQRKIRSEIKNWFNTECGVDANHSYGASVPEPEEIETWMIPAVYDIARRAAAYEQDALNHAFKSMVEETGKEFENNSEVNSWINYINTVEQLHDIIEQNRNSTYVVIRSTYTIHEKSSTKHSVAFVFNKDGLVLEKVIDLADELNEGIQSAVDMADNSEPYKMAMLIKELENNYQN